MLAVSWVFPPTRMCTEPARCTKLDMRFRKGTCKNVLGKRVKRIKKRMRRIKVDLRIQAHCRRKEQI